MILSSSSSSALSSSSSSSSSDSGAENVSGWTNIDLPKCNCDESEYEITKISHIMVKFLPGSLTGVINGLEGVIGVLIPPTRTYRSFHPL